MNPRPRHILKWTLFVALFLALVIVPFMIYGERIDAWTHHFLETAGRHRTFTSAVLGGLLASDILFPIPSSMVSTGAGLTLGLLLGTAVSSIGMIVSCVVGYWLGAVCGRPLATRMVGEGDLVRFEILSRKIGSWAIILARPIPVLAEVSVLFAGISRLSFPRFLLVSTLSNIGISAVYAAIGTYATSANAFLLAFLGAMALPGLGMLVLHRFRRA
ncbi:MAG: VTT domain-containing protein [Lentisphaerae bacterium]|nr:VTT domain-containing protein [Lentisphaerota bacterium]